MDIDYVVTEGDKPGPIEVDCTYSDGTSPSFAGTETVVFRMRPWATNPAVVNGAGAVVDSDTLRYEWGDTDFTAKSGLYEAQFRVERTDGRRETFPSVVDGPRYIRIWVEPAISVEPVMMLSATQGQAAQ